MRVLFCPPSAVGVKRSVRVVPWPGTLNGVAGAPTRVKSVPGSCSELIVSVPGPPAVILRVSSLDDFTATVPKSNEAGVTLMRALEPVTAAAWVTVRVWPAISAFPFARRPYWLPPRNSRFRSPFRQRPNSP